MRLRGREMREVVVIGVGMTVFGKHPDSNFIKLGTMAVWDALKDSNIKPGNIQAAYCGSAITGLITGQECNIGHLVLEQIGIRGIPIVRIENACVSGSAAFREAYISVGSGVHDIALAFGVEHVSGALEKEQVMRAVNGASDIEREVSKGMVFPGSFALIANRHIFQYGTTREQMAKVSVKNHRNGLLNRRAQYGMEISIQDVLNSKMLTDPLRMYDYSPVSDGAAAVILCAKDLAKKFTDKRIRVLASSLRSGEFDPKGDITTFPATKNAAKDVYEASGYGPEDVSLAEVHDCFTIAEIIHYEDLGFCEKGKGGQFIGEGKSEMGGKVPFNASGGLMSKGHPLGATGLAQISEIVWQLRGEAGKRQVQNAKIGLTHNLGGYMHGDTSAVAVHLFQKDS